MANEVSSPAPAAEGASPGSTELNALESQVAENTGESSEGNEAVAAEAKPAKKEAAPPSSKRKLKLRIDNEDVEDEIDLSDEKELIKRMQLAKVAQKRIQEFAELQKDVADFITELRKDPKRVLRDPNIGLDIKKLAADIIEEEIENSKKSPEQLAREKLETELKSLKEEREKEKSDAQSKEFERLKEQQFERYDMLMEQALNKTDLPKSPYVVKKIADYMLLGLQDGKDVTPEDVIPLVREEIMEDLKSMFQIMPEDVIEKLVGKDKIDQIRKKNISKAKEKVAVGSNKVLDVVKKGESKDKNAPQKKTFKEFFGV